MSTLERNGLWGWRLAGAVVAIALYVLVVRPLVDAAVHEVEEQLAAEPDPQ